MDVRGVIGPNHHTAIVVIFIGWALLIMIVVLLSSDP